MQTVAVLLHNAHEIFTIDLAVAVVICRIDHLLQLLIGHVLAEFVGDPLEVLERDTPRLVVIKSMERLQDLIIA